MSIRISIMVVVMTKKVTRQIRTEMVKVELMLMIVMMIIIVIMMIVVVKV